MYLKTYHPYEFMASWINSEEGDLKKLRECYSEAKSLGLRVEKPTWRNISGLTRVVSL